MAAAACRAELEFAELVAAVATPRRSLRDKHFREMMAAAPREAPGSRPALVRAAGRAEGGSVAVQGATHARGHAHGHSAVPSDCWAVLTVALARSPGEEVGTALEDGWHGELVTARFDCGRIDGLDRFAPARAVFHLGGYAFASTGTLDVRCRVSDRPLVALASSPPLDVAVDRDGRSDEALDVPPPDNRCPVR